MRKPSARKFPKATPTHCPHSADGCRSTKRHETASAMLTRARARGDANQTNHRPTKRCARAANAALENKPNQTKPTITIQLMIREDTTILSNMPYSWFDLQNRKEKGFQPRPFGFIAPPSSKSSVPAGDGTLFGCASFIARLSVGCVSARVCD